MPIIGIKRRAGPILPRHPFAINYDSVQSQGLKNWWVPIAGGIAHDFGPGGAHLTANDAGDGALIGTEFGSGWDFVGTGEKLIGNFSGATTTTYVSGWFQHHYSVFSGTNMRPFGITSGGDGGHIVRSAGHGSAAFQNAWYKEPGFDVLKHNTVPTIHEWCLLGCAFISAARWQLYFNGALDGNDTCTLVTGVSTKAIIGSAGGERDTNITVGEIRLYDSAEQDDTDLIAQLQYDPATRFDLFYELGRRTIFLPAAAGGDQEVLTHPKLVNRGLLTHSGLIG